MGTPFVLIYIFYRFRRFVNFRRFFSRFFFGSGQHAAHPRRGCPTRSAAASSFHISGSRTSARVLFDLCASAG